MTGKGPKEGSSLLFAFVSTCCPRSFLFLCVLVVVLACLRVFNLLGATCWIQVMWLYVNLLSCLFVSSLLFGSGSEACSCSYGGDPASHEACRLTPGKTPLGIWKCPRYLLQSENRKLPPCGFHWFDGHLFCGSITEETCAPSIAPLRLAKLCHKCNEVVYRGPNCRRLKAHQQSGASLHQLSRAEG